MLHAWLQILLDLNTCVLKIFYTVHVDCYIAPTKLFISSRYFWVFLIDSSCRTFSTIFHFHYHRHDTMCSCSVHVALTTFKYSHILLINLDDFFIKDRQGYSLMKEHQIDYLMEFAMQTFPFATSKPHQTTQSSQLQIQLVKYI